MFEVTTGHLRTTLKWEGQLNAEWDIVLSEEEIEQLLAGTHPKLIAPTHCIFWVNLLSGTVE